MKKKKRILILCTGNSCRSQMAEGFMRKYASGKAEVYSAGTEVHGLNAKAVEVMSEAGIDISLYKSKSVNQFLGQQFDYVITVCDNARESCPVYTGATTVIHNNFQDPAIAIGSPAEVMQVFRSIRDQIAVFCENFVLIL